MAGCVLTDLPGMLFCKRVHVCGLLGLAKVSCGNMKTWAYKYQDNCQTVIVAFLNEDLEDEV